MHCDNNGLYSSPLKDNGIRILECYGTMLHAESLGVHPKQTGFQWNLQIQDEKTRWFQLSVTAVKPCVTFGFQGTPLELSVDLVAHTRVWSAASLPVSNTWSVASAASDLAFWGCHSLGASACSSL